jgi:phosphohistidine swiveling domain-containing protein
VSHRADETLERLCQRVPAADRAELTQMVLEARAAYGLRDENGPYNVTWPAGLLRRAALEAGRRLTRRGALRHPEHAFEIPVAQLIGLVNGSQSPTADDVAERAERRARWSAAAAPAALGRPDVGPPTAAMPHALRLMTEAVVAASTNLGTAPMTEPLHGQGIGDRPYTGRARVARSPEEALGLLEPGEVLVTPMTTPAYNAVLPLAGALVVEEGGALCHAAVIARELDIPTLVGVSDALTLIADGDEVEVDPRAGAVRIVRAAHAVAG